jgi:hypothetical protein
MTWRNRTLLVGSILGALSGLGAALLYIRSVEDSGSEEPKKIPTGDALKMVISVFTLIKQVSNLAN